ncbi:hypothetical protein Malapachy_1460 [Malassezia pachydermatis]|uniref:Rabenosyn Rab binding domain-containing protein n=1 Tax=Malassezia pachydermatis TaxID=77020 RepID=A0A0M8MMS7_9BASI|nr:hypothetical protein Malapachy_1460 [Malassezia pachydermatis]KOS13257.1 hypothetical protein Malapachy_1460 [Malassezia pachydermatis]
MALISDYDALRHLQQEIDEALPNFHEMLLGLKKNDMDIALASTLRDNCALQADAIQARKDLLARFSQFDQLARKIERLPPTVHGLVSPTQKRLQQAIFSRATIYLQRNMFPLQSLPVARKEKSKSSPSTSATNLPLEAQQQINVLSEQEALLSSYLEAAKKARNLDDVLSLKQSQNEIRAEIEQIIAKHTM